MIREATRGEDMTAHERRSAENIRETRAIGSSGGSTVSATGGASVFVPPAIVFEDFAIYLQRAVFANQITVDDVPEYGMQISIPAVTSDAGAQSQGGDGNQLNETDPGAAFVSTTLQTFAGVVTISTQLYDRSGNESGYSYDRIIGKQLALDYAKSLDSYAITQATSNATTILYNGSFALAGTSTTGGFIDRLAQAKANIRGTSGQYLEPSALFLAPTRWEYIAGWADSSGRPVVLPGPGEAGKRPYGSTGLEWGGLDVYTDSNLAGISFGTTAEDMVLVADPSEVYLWRTQQPALQAYVSPSAGSLEVQVRLYGYGATLTRYADALQVISGTALSPVSF
jgi:HK97 family phage major capsid protein